MPRSKKSKSSRRAAGNNNDDQPYSPHSWQYAASLAARWHHHALRKDGKTPYFAHPVRVTLTIITVFGVSDPVILTAALLHDTIEDTQADYEDILDIFGPEVADIVAALSKDFRLPEKKRERAYDRQLAAGPWQARLIKLADVYDNICDSRPGPGRKKALSRAPRAIAIAKKDPRLAPAVRVLRKLVSAVS